MVQDQMQVHTDSVKEFTTSFQLQNHHIEQLHKREEANTAETWLRFTELEEYCSAIDLDLTRASSRLIRSINQLVKYYGLSEEDCDEMQCPVVELAIKPMFHGSHKFGVNGYAICGDELMCAQDVIMNVKEQIKKIEEKTFIKTEGLE